MEHERDWFSEGWGEDGGIVSDSREVEELPEEAAEREDAGDEVGVETDGAGEGEAARDEDDVRRESADSPGQAVLRGQVASKAEREADFVRFVEAYPHVNARSIPKSVWRGVIRGESLVAAYARYEAETLREENRVLRQTEANRRRSAGSQRGVGAGERRRDAFEDGWEDAY